MKILFLPKYHKEGASSRYRTHNYLRYFNEKEHDVTIKPLFHNGYVKELYTNKRKNFIKVLKDYVIRIIFLITHKQKFDLIIVEKELLPYIPISIERILLSSCKYTLDFDDAISTKYKKGPFTKFFFGNKINTLSKNAYLTTVGNHWYWNEITEGNLQYLPTVIDIYQYNVGKLNNIKPKEKEKTTIVWIGSPSTVKYLNIVKDTLIKLSKKYDFTLRVIGAKFHIESVDVECVEWSEESEFQYLYESDIGIMPLYETLWEKGKCGFKCIQYMAAKLPVVSSKLPANEEIIIHNNTGYIVENEEDWYGYLEKLIKSPEKCYEFGNNGRQRVEQQYTYQVWGEKYTKMIENIID